MGFDRFYGTSGCSTGQPPYCFIDQDQTVGNPSVEKPIEMAGARRGLMVPDWDHKEVNATLQMEGACDGIFNG